MGSEDGGHRGLEPEEGASFEVLATAPRRVGEFAVAVLMALFCLMNLFPPSGEAFLPWLMAPFGAIASLHFFRRVFDGRPRLVVDEEGVVDRTALIGGELRMPWAEILSVSASGLRNTVELTVRDPVALRSMSGFWRRVGLRLGRLIGRRSVSINLTLLGFSKRQLKERLDDGLLRFERTQLGLGDPELSPGTMEQGYGPRGIGQRPGREGDQMTNTVARFNYRHEAEYAQGFLHEAGIVSSLLVDDAGGAEVGLSFSNPARLVVNEGDVERAREVLVAAGLVET